MEFDVARFNMVENQVRANKVTNPALVAAMGALPRERFVPEAAAGIAYVDEVLAIGEGRFLMEPMILARLIQSAEVDAGDTVLDVGCGTGYSSAVLSKVAGAVVAVESVPALAAKASNMLAELGLDNVAVVEGALEEGYPKQAPYDVILLGGAVAEFSKVLTDQLADGGRLVGVMDDGSGPGRATLLVRVGNSFSKRTLFEAGTAHLPGFEPRPRFVF